MKAVICSRGGTPDVLELREIEKPVPRDEQVLIRVCATTVTFGDAMLRRMRGPLRWIFGLAFGMGRNTILGHEFAGVIEIAGKRVSRFEVGDRVFGSTGKRGGAHAEYICQPQDGMLVTMPASASFEQAAAVPIGANTALVILRKAGILKERKVLVYGASGSVGTYAVQLARHFEAEVTGVCSTPNLELVESLSGQQALDYTKVDFTQTGERYDVIFDAVGKLSPQAAQAALHKDGKFLTVNSPTSEKTEDLHFLKELVEAGELKPVIDRTYPLEAIREAHAYVDLGHKRGNVVIQVCRHAAGSA